MPRQNYFNTGDQVPATASYATFCDNAQLLLDQNGVFPPCPMCQLAASWRRLT